MPGHRAPRRDQGGHRAVVAQADAAGRTGGIRRVVGERVVQCLRQDAAARNGGGTAHRQSPNLIGLEQLEVTDVVDFAGVCAEGLRVAPGDLQIVGLLFIGVIARRRVAADDQRQVVGAKKILEGRQVHAFLDENLLFDQGERRRWYPRGQDTRPDFDRVQFPELPRIRDQEAADIITRCRCKAGGEQRARPPEGARFLQRFEAEIIKGNRVGRRALIGIEGGSERVNRDERPVAHRKRIAVKPGAVRLRCALGRDVGDVHEIRIERRWTGESENLA